MSIALTDEQLRIGQTVRSFLDRRCTEADVRRVMETVDGYDRDVWRKMASGLQLQALLIPEAHGGVGYSHVELGVVFEEMGRSLLCAPFLATVALATNALLASGDDDAQATYLPGIAEGRTIATLALAEGSGPATPDSLRCEASETAHGWTITGDKTFVVDGHIADLILVVARTDQGLSLFAVGGDECVRRPLQSLDATRRMSHLTFQAAPGRLVGPVGGAWPFVQRAIQLANVALAAEQVGGAQRVLDMAVEYAGQRVQFGRTIGSFQAVKHMCADMLVDVECARGVAYDAMRIAADGDIGELPMASSVARAFCSEVYFRAAENNIQIHGGTGFTWDHPAHLYFRRARSSQFLLGSQAEHRAHIADALSAAL